MLAKWQAIPAPITPEPSTAAFLILLLIDAVFGLNKKISEFSLAVQKYKTVANNGLFIWENTQRKK
jgi:hypothetical protein